MGCGKEWKKIRQKIFRENTYGNLKNVDVIDDTYTITNYTGMV